MWTVYVVRLHLIFGVKFVCVCVRVCVFVRVCERARTHTQNRNAFAHSLPPEKFETNRIKSTLEYVFIGIFTFFLSKKCNNNANNQLNKLHDHLKSPNSHFSVSFSPHMSQPMFDLLKRSEKKKMYETIIKNY